MLQKEMCPLQLGDVAHTFTGTALLSRIFNYHPKTVLEEGDYAF